MKNAVSRFLGEQGAPVVARHPGGGHPRRRFRAACHVDEPVEVAACPPHLIDDGGDAVVGGCIGRHRDDGQALLRERDHVLAQVLLRPAHRDDRGAGLRGQSSHRGTDAATARTRHDDDAAVQPQEIIHGDDICPDNIRCSAYCRTLFRSGNRLVKAG